MEIDPVFAALVIDARTAEGIESPYSLSIVPVPLVRIAIDPLAPEVVAVMELPRGPRIAARLSTVILPE